MNRKIVCALLSIISFSAVAQKQSYHIGQRAQGGIIYYLYETGDGIQHGLVLSVIHLAVDVEWGQKGLNVANTAAILKADSTEYIAARLCENYSYDGYSDWYLPALHELSAIKQSSYLVDRALTQLVDAEPMVLDLYWTSTQSNEMAAWFYDFKDDKPSNYYDKTSKFLVRAIRAF
jgi:hypothetical protein